MSRPDRLGHESEVRSSRAVPASERIAPLSDSQRWKAGIYLALHGLSVAGKRWSEDPDENVKHGFGVVQGRAYKYGRFVGKRLRMCADKRRVKWLLRRIRIGVGPLRSPQRVAFELGLVDAYVIPIAEREASDANQS